MAIMRHKLRTMLVVVPLLAVAVPVSYYLLSPLWSRTTIYEESPLAAAGISVAGVPAATSTPPSMPTDGQGVTVTPTAKPAMPAATRQSTPTSTPELPDATTEPTPVTEPTSTATELVVTTEPEPATEPVIEPTLEPGPEPTATPETAPEPTPEPAPVEFTPRLVSSGPLSGADDFHFASGTALLIETEPGIYVLRLEEFSVRNGPDLFVYLAAGPDYLDDAAINLGALRATDGSINYDIPPGTDISQFQGVVIWCRAFAVFFGSAPLIAS
jgi:hypothetical protein